MKQLLNQYYIDKQTYGLMASKSCLKFLPLGAENVYRFFSEIFSSCDLGSSSASSTVTLGAPSG